MQEIELIICSVLVGLVSSFLNALSYIIQKKAHLLNQGSPRPIFKHPVWLIGFGVMLVGSIISLGKNALDSDHGNARPNYDVLALWSYYHPVHCFLLHVSKGTLH